MPLFGPRLVCLLLLVVALLAVGVGAVAARVAFPVVWGMDAEQLRAEVEAVAPVDLPTPALFVSDFHLVHGQEDLRIDIPLEGINSIVIVGDFFQSPDDFHWFDLAETDEERIAAGLRVFLSEDYEGPVYWISALQHDPQIEPLRFTKREGVEVAHVGKIGRFVAGGHPIVAIHGDEFFSGWAGGGVSWLLQRFGISVPLERISRRRLQLPDDTWLVMAHTHVPGLHEPGRTANTGSFAGVPFNNVLRVHVGTGILFTEDAVELLEYEGIEPTLYP